MHGRVPAGRAGGGLGRLRSGGRVRLAGAALRRARDADGDRVFVPSEGTLCAGATLPSGHTDAWPLEIDCDDADALAWQWRYAYPDADRDTVAAASSEAVCAGYRLPAGWFAEPGTDCAPTDATRWQTWTYSYRDADGDQRTVRVFGGSVCGGAARPDGYVDTAQLGTDCDDANAEIWASLWAWPDADGDRVGEGTGTLACTSGLPPPGTVLVGGDCAPGDGTRWQAWATAGSDADGDGYTTREAAEVCAAASLPEPYRLVASGNDCDDAEPLLWRWIVLYRDADGGGVGTPPRWIPCLGADLPSGWSLLGFDANDGDPGVVGSTAPEWLALEP